MFGLNVSRVEEDDFLSILEKLMERLDDEDLELVAMVARRIWLQKHIVVYGGELLHHSHLVRSAKDFMEEFHKAEKD
jgi:DNA-binding IclR family transcriptional regulator